MKLARSLAVFAALLLVMGCKDDKPSQPQVQPTLAEMWPNEDGRFWLYDGTSRIWDSTPFQYDLSPTPIPLPSLTELAALAAAREFPQPSTLANTTYRLQFNGMITTGSGVTQQNLTAELLPVAALSGLTPRSTATLLRRLAIARPDLRARIAQRMSRDGSVQAEILSGFLLHGYAWEKTADWIGSYGDNTQLLTWKYLESDLTTGHEFALQLVPELASDVYLRVRVLGRAPIVTPAGTYANAIEVFYVVDFGVEEATDASGNFLGFNRQIEYGSIHFVPGVGPVANYERVNSTFGPHGLGPGYGELHFLLRSSGLTS